MVFCNTIKNNKSGRDDAKVLLALGSFFLFTYKYPDSEKTNKATSITREVAF